MERIVKIYKLTYNGANYISTRTLHCNVNNY